MSHRGQRLDPGPLEDRDCGLREPCSAPPVSAQRRSPSAGKRAAFPGSKCTDQREPNRSSDPPRDESLAAWVQQRCDGVFGLWSKRAGGDGLARRQGCRMTHRATHRVTHRTRHVAIAEHLRARHPEVIRGLVAPGGGPKSDDSSCDSSAPASGFHPAISTRPTVGTGSKILTQSTACVAGKCEKGPRNDANVA